MWDFSVGRSVAMVAATWPFVLLRVLVYAIVAAAYLLLIGCVSGIGYGLGQIVQYEDGPLVYGVGGGLVGLGIAHFLFRLIAQYILYIVKAGHIAVLIELLDGRPVPGALSQIAHGRAIVTERFAEASTLFVLDQLIKAVLRTVAGIFRGIGALIPIPGLSAIIGLLNAVVGIAVSYVDEVILAYNIRSGVNAPWDTSRRALVLYAQNGRTMLKNAFWLALVIWLVGIVFFLLFLSPAAALAYWMPGQLAGWSVAIAIVATLAALAALVEPFAVASLMQVYFKVIDGQQPDPEWDERLASVSRQFREIKDRALASLGRPPAAT